MRALPFSKTNLASVRHIGLVRHDHGIGSVEVVCGGDMPHVAWCDFRDIGPGGEHETFAQFIRERKLGKVECTAVLPVNLYQTFIEEMAPNVARAEQADALRWNIMDRLDYDISDAVLDVYDQPLPPRVGAKQMVYVVAAQRQHILANVEAFYHSGKTRIAHIDIHEMALRNIAALLPEDVEGVATLHLRARDGLLVITRDRTLYLARKIDMGLTQIFDFLGWRQNSDEIEKALTEWPGLDDICSQVQSTLDYYFSRFMPNHIDRLYLAPMERPLPELRAAMSERLAVRVKNLRLEEIVAFDGDTPDESLQGKILPALGVCLTQADCGQEFKQQVNLFNDSFLPKRNWLTAQQILTVALGLMLLVGAVSGYLFWKVDQGRIQLATEKKRLHTLEAKVAQLAKLYPEPTVDKALEKHISQVEGQLLMKKLIRQILDGGYDFGNTKGFSGYFHELAKNKLEGVWITRMRILNGGERLGLYGKSSDPRQIPVMIGNFQSSTHLSGHAFSQIKINKDGVVQFSLLTHPMDDKDGDHPAGNAEVDLQPKAPFASLMEKFVGKALENITGKN